MQFTEAVVNLKFDEEPKYGAYMRLFEPLCGSITNRPIITNVPPPQVGQKRSRDSNDDILLDSTGNLKKKVRLGLPATQWTTVYNAHRPMKQRYHYNVANMRVEQHVVKGNDDGLFISSVACCQVCAPRKSKLATSAHHLLMPGCEKTAKQWAPVYNAHQPMNQRYY
jgi:hypothetical protein